jgi:hypothetical protein
MEMKMLAEFPKTKPRTKRKSQKGTSMERRMALINTTTNNGKCWWLHQYLLGFVRSGGSTHSNET